MKKEKLMDYRKAYAERKLSGVIAPVISDEEKVWIAKEWIDNNACFLNRQILKRKEYRYEEI